MKYHMGFQRHDWSIVILALECAKECLNGEGAYGLQVMEEIIAKSKKGKAERQTQREDDLRATEELDATFTDLLQGASLATMLRAKGEKTCVARAF